MDCTRSRDRLSEYADGALDAETRADLEKHLSSCAECREELSSLQRLIRDLGSLPSVKPPADFLRQVHKRLEQPSRLRRLVGKLLFPLKFKIPLQLAGAVLAALLVFSVVTVQRRPYKVAEAPQPEPAREKRLVMRADKGGAPAEKPGSKTVGLKDGPHIVEWTLALAGPAPAPRGPEPALEGRTSQREVQAPQAALQAADEAEGRVDPVRKSIEAFEGRVLSVEHERGRPVSILAEVPSDKYSSLLNDLRELGEVRVPPPAPSDETRGPVRIRVRIVSGD